MKKIPFALVMWPALAMAQPRSADAYYEEGSNQYNLGNFEKAIEAFKKGFELEPDESKKANYLYNVAQSYRQSGDCKNALFFYKRYLALKANDTAKPITTKKRREVEDKVADLEKCVQQQQTISQKPPTNSVPPDGEASDKSPPPTDAGHKAAPKEVSTAAPGNTPPSSGGGGGGGGGGVGSGGEEDEGASVTATVAGPPHLISLRLTGGGTKVFASSDPMKDVPIQATVALTAGYPIAINDKLVVEAGAALSFRPVPFNDKTAQLWAVMANGAAMYEVIPKLWVRGDAGIGAQFFAGLDKTEFVPMDSMVTGALSMFHLRGAASADYAVTPNLVLTATPIAVSWSPPPSGLISDIKAITSIDFMVGLGYRK